MIKERQLLRNEIRDVWTIDRTELIEAIYYLEDGDLVLKPERYDMKGWPPGEAEKATPLLEDCFDHGGWFYGFFADKKMIGAAVLESRFIGRGDSMLQLAFLHVSSSYRGQGLGKRLFRLSADEAVRRGASGMYISATPSEHTVDFYLAQGCRVTQEPDAELLALEPEDIHFEFDLEAEISTRTASG